MQTATVVPNLMDAIAATMAKPEKKTKTTNKFPVIDTPETREHADAIIAAKATKKKAEAEISFHGQELAAVAREKMDDSGFGGKFASTYSVPGTTGEVKVIYENKFTIPYDNKADLVALLGNKFGDLIEEQVTVTLRPEVLSNPELGQKLMSMLGHDFLEFFTSKTELVASPTLKEDIYKAVDRDGLELFRHLVKQYNPSIK